MGWEADAGKATETRQEGQKNERGVREGRGEERNGTWKRKEKAESVLSDKQEILRQGFLRQNVTIQKGKFSEQKHVYQAKIKRIRQDPMLHLRN